MAIVNVTPDSFFAGSRRQSEAEIATATERAVRDGAGIIDLGGYSSRPGADDVSTEEEFGRLENGFRRVREVAGEAFPVSVDTFRAEVVERLYDRFGAFVVNDISAGELDSAMLRTVGRLGLPYVAMHMRGTPQTMTAQTDYPAERGGVVGEVVRYFVRKAAELREAGVGDWMRSGGRVCQDADSEFRAVGADGRAGGVRGADFGRTFAQESDLADAGDWAGGGVERYLGAELGGAAARGVGAAGPRRAGSGRDGAALPGLSRRRTTGTIVLRGVGR